MLKKLLLSLAIVSSLMPVANVRATEPELEAAAYGFLAFLGFGAATYALNISNQSGQNTVFATGMGALLALCFTVGCLRVFAERKELEQFQRMSPAEQNAFMMRKLQRIEWEQFLAQMRNHR